MHFRNVLLVTLCWSLLVLRGASLAADDGPPATPPLPGPGIPRHVALADPTLAATPEQRQQLMYLVRCALPEEVVLYADIGAERFTFPGWMGLAPGWLTAAMTPREERWVSACILAHVNYFGAHVRVSMRATPPPSQAFTADAAEQQTYTLFEGGFFGNLFTATPVAYVCRGDRTPDEETDPILQQRICTQATAATTAAGLPLTPCRFLLTGRCADASSFTVAGQTYTEVIWTYLRPTPPE
jgi:hypothetical protein